MLLAAEAGFVTVKMKAAERKIVLKRFEVPNFKSARIRRLIRESAANKATFKTSGMLHWTDQHERRENSKARVGRFR